MQSILMRLLARLSIAYIVVAFGCTGSGDQTTESPSSGPPTSVVTSAPQASPTPVVPVDESRLSGACASAAEVINRAWDEADTYESESPGGSPASDRSSDNMHQALADIDAASPKVRACGANDVGTAYAFADARIYLIFNTDFGIDPGDLAKIQRDLDRLRARRFNREHPDEYEILRSQLEADQAKLNGG